jgi:hypothetical protein
LHATEDDQLAATREAARVAEPDASFWRRAIAIAVTGGVAIAPLSVIVLHGGYFAVAALWIWLGLALLLAAAAAARHGAAVHRTRASNRG